MGCRDAEPAYATNTQLLNIFDKLYNRIYPQKWRQSAEYMLGLFGIFFREHPQKELPKISNRNSMGPEIPLTIEDAKCNAKYDD